MNGAVVKMFSVGGNTVPPQSVLIPRGSEREVQDVWREDRQERPAGRRIASCSSSPHSTLITNHNGSVRLFLLLKFPLH